MTRSRHSTQRTRIGQWRTFERRFDPVDAPHGSLLHEAEDLPKAVDEHLVWTVVDCDGRLYATPGYRFVNRLGYLVCTRPWDDDDQRQPDYRYD